MLRVIFRLALIFVVAFAGVKVGYNRLENHLLSSVPEVKVAQTGPAANKVEILRKPLDYKIILDRNIFGAALEKTDITENTKPVEDLQPTKLKLALMGTVSGDQNGSRAIISDETSKKQDIYGVGDTIQGAKIKAIERRRVVLNVNGRDEVLNIKEREGGGTRNTRLSSSPTSSEERKTLRDRLSLRRPLVRPETKTRQRTPVRSSGRRNLRGVAPPGADADELIEMTDDDLLEDPQMMEEENIEEPELLDEEQ